MEPHSHIVHSRRDHIGSYVKPYVSICLCGSNKLKIHTCRLALNIVSPAVFLLPLFRSFNPAISIPAPANGGKFVLLCFIQHLINI